MKQVSHFLLDDFWNRTRWNIVPCFMNADNPDTPIIHPVIFRPEPEDILPGNNLWSQNVGDIAISLLPWARKSHRFTHWAAMMVLGYDFLNVAHRREDERHVKFVRRALYRLGCRNSGKVTFEEAEQAGVNWDPVMQYWIPTHRCDVFTLPLTIRQPQNDVPLFPSIEGLSVDPNIPRPPKSQVEFAKRWLTEFCRPRKTMNMDRSSNSYCKYAQNWSETLPETSTTNQVDEETGEIFQDTRILVSEGAVLQAGLEMGYSVCPAKKGSSGHMNVSIRKPGKPFRGVPPKMPTTPNGIFKPEPEVRAKRKKRVVTSSDVLDIVKIKAKLITFLKGRKQFAHERRYLIPRPYPYFSLKHAAHDCGVPYKGVGGVPAVLTRTLKQLGCVRTYEMRSGVQKSRWCRVEDMLYEWQSFYWHGKGDFTRSSQAWEKRHLDVLEDLPPSLALEIEREVKSRIKQKKKEAQPRWLFLRERKKRGRNRGPNKTPVKQVPQDNDDTPSE